MSGEPESRRTFLRRAVAAAAFPALGAAGFGREPVTGQGNGTGPAQDSLAGRGALGTLRDPAVVGTPRAPTDVAENAAEIQAIERRLACNCGCTLDVFTCRTTDFSCTYSPRLHREVLALRSQGLTAQQVLDAFVAKYGEKALMAPEPKGFNLAGYLVPGVTIAAVGVALVALIGRRRAAVTAAGTQSSAGAPAAPSDLQATPDELERLRRALADVED